jgi:gluconolactonase
MKWEEETGHVIVFRKPSNYANGNTQDRQGRLVTCEHGSRRVTRTEHDGSITVILDRYDGKPLNSPNDVVVKSDGSIWFSDPPFGIAGNYEGNAATPELPQNVYRVDGEMGQASVVASDLRSPNGLCFSPDETKLYVVESRATPNRLIRVYDVVNGRKLVNNRIFVTPARALPMGCAPTSMVTCGAAGEWELPSSMAFSSIHLKASRSAVSTYRSAAPTFVSAEPSATGCSWQRASRSIRFTLTRRGHREAEALPEKGPSHCREARNARPGAHRRSPDDPKQQGLEQERVLREP